MTSKAELLAELRSWPLPHRLGLALLVAWIVLGPLGRQVFDVVDSPFLPAWHMFRTWGVNTVVVELYDGATDTRLDRAELLGVDQLRRTELVLHNARELNQQVARICRANPGLDLRVVAKMGRVRGWVPLSDGSANACR